LVRVSSLNDHPLSHRSIRAFETLTIRLPQLVGCGHRYDFDRKPLISFDSDPAARTFNYPCVA
jgi:hypothetical protein